MDQRKVKFGMIGTNFISDWFMEASKHQPLFQLVSVYSRTLEKAHDFGSIYGATKHYDNLEEMVSSPEIDCVYIASPNSLHSVQAVLCMKHKKHVLVEKPFASNSKEAQAMIAAAKENNVILMEAMKTTQLPNFKLIKENLNKIGKVRRYFGNFCQYSSRYDKFKEGIIENAFKLELSNGALMDIGVYCIYPMVALFGLPKKITGNAILLSTGVDGEGSACCIYDDMIGDIQFSKITSSFVPSEIQGENGSIVFENLLNFNKVKIIYRNGTEEVLSKEQAKDDMIYEIEEFISLVKGNKKDSEDNSLQNSFYVMNIMDKIRKDIGLKYPADDEKCLI